MSSNSVVICVSAIKVASFKATIIELSDPAERAAAVRKEVECLEEWFPPTRDGLAGIEAFEVAHLQSVMAEIDEVRARIVALEESPRPA